MIANAFNDSATGMASNGSSSVNTAMATSLSACRNKANSYQSKLEMKTSLGCKRASLKYEDIKIQKSDGSTYTILVSDNKKVPNLNTVLKQIHKHKLNVIEANFQKVNLEKIFRTITTGNN